MIRSSEADSGAGGSNSNDTWDLRRYEQNDPSDGSASLCLAQLKLCEGHQCQDAPRSRMVARKAAYMWSRLCGVLHLGQASGAGEGPDELDRRGRGRRPRPTSSAAGTVVVGSQSTSGSRRQGSTPGDRYRGPREAMIATRTAEAAVLPAVRRVRGDRGRIAAREYVHRGADCQNDLSLEHQPELLVRLSRAFLRAAPAGFEDDENPLRPLERFRRHQRLDSSV